jgi:lysophospholipase L1-like esterase
MSFCRTLSSVATLAAITATLILARQAQAADPPAARPKVLLLGDSISLGYTEHVRTALQDKADVSRPGENCQHTGHGLKRIKTWLGTEKWDVIHFNWGIWDTHMLDDKGTPIRDEARFPGKLHIRHTPEQYRENLTTLVEILEGTGAKLVWASTTPIMYRSGERFEDIPKYNAIAAELMRARGIAINDLYALVLPSAKQWQTGDRVHFTKTGSEKLAAQVSESILAALADGK